MTRPLALLVVDVSEAWEEDLKSQERGFAIDWEPVYPGRFERRKLNRPSEDLGIAYPHGSVRAGLNAIIDTVRLAAQYGVPRYAVHLYDGWTDGEEQTCQSLQPYVPKGNQYEKHDYSAFSCALADRLMEDGIGRLLVVGFDRDFCVLETIKDAVARGITVITSEHCMLTSNRDKRRRSSLAYFRKHTVFLKSLVDVWNFLNKQAR